MKTSAFDRYTRSSCILLPLLAGCGGLRPSISAAPQVAPQSVGAGSASQHLRRSLAPHPLTGFGYQLLYSFKGGSRDGSEPDGRLTAINGTLYGTTASGGSFCVHIRHRCGTIFSITTAGSERVLHFFQSANSSDGAIPNGRLTRLNGTLYGTTKSGGDPGCELKYFHGCGTIFSISPSGSSYGVLYPFPYQRNGREPWFPNAGLTALNGMLYGTTSYGGT